MCPWVGRINALGRIKFGAPEHSQKTGKPSLHQCKRGTKVNPWEVSERIKRRRKGSWTSGLQIAIFLLLSGIAFFDQTLQARLSAEVGGEDAKENQRSSEVQANYVQVRLAILGIGAELGFNVVGEQYFALVEQEAVLLLGDFYNFLVGTKLPISETIFVKIATGYHYDPAISEDKSGMIFSVLMGWQSDNKWNLGLEFLGGAITVLPQDKFGSAFLHVPKITMSYYLE